MVKLRLQQSFSVIQNWSNAWKSVEINFLKMSNNLILKALIISQTSKFLFCLIFLTIMEKYVQVKNLTRGLPRWGKK